jgi:hypothetical protein
VHQSIEDTPTLNRVTRQEQEVYVGQLPRYVFVQDTAYNGVKVDAGVRLARYTSRYMHFVPSESLTQLLEPPISRLSEQSQRVGARSTNYARQVRHIHPIEVHCYDVSYAQPGQPLVDERAAATKTYDADLELGQNVLPDISEQTRMPIEYRIRSPRACRRSWIQPDNLRSYDSGVAEFKATLQRPYVAGYGIVSKDERSNRAAPGYIQQGGIATLVRGHVVARESNLVVTAMTMHSQVT